MASSAKKKKQREMEKQDAQGISRKKYNRTMDFNVYAIIKGVLIVLIPVMYFLYSPALIFIMLAYVALYYLAILAERGMNKSVIKANHIHIPKFDSALALFVIVIAFAGTILSLASVAHGPQFGGDEGNVFGGIMVTIERTLKNFGSLLTGERSLLTFGFGTKSPPSGGGGHGPKSFSLDDLPLEYLISIILSTVCTVLLCLIIILGIVSLALTFYKRWKFSKMMNEVIYDSELRIFSDEELDEILSFGEDEATAGMYMSEEKEKKKKPKKDRGKSGPPKDASRTEAPEDAPADAAEGTLGERQPGNGDGEPGREEPGRSEGER